MPSSDNKTLCQVETKGHVSMFTSSGSVCNRLGSSFLLPVGQWRSGMCLLHHIHHREGDPCCRRWWSSGCDNIFPVEGCSDGTDHCRYPREQTVPQNGHQLWPRLEKIQWIKHLDCNLIDFRCKIRAVITKNSPVTQSTSDLQGCVSEDNPLHVSSFKQVLFLLWNPPHCSLQSLHADQSLHRPSRKENL